MLRHARTAIRCLFRWFLRYTHGGIIYPAGYLVNALTTRNESANIALKGMEFSRITALGADDSYCVTRSR
jgi:hypothetical protein